MYRKGSNYGDCHSAGNRPDRPRGEEAFRQIRSIRPEARVIVSSGYNEVEAVRRFTTKGIAGWPPGLPER